MVSTDLQRLHDIPGKPRIARNKHFKKKDYINSISPNLEE